MKFELHCKLLVCMAVILPHFMHKTSLERKILRN